MALPTGYLLRLRARVRDGGICVEWRCVCETRDTFTVLLPTGHSLQYLLQDNPFRRLGDAYDRCLLLRGAGGLLFILEGRRGVILQDDCNCPSQSTHHPYFFPVCMYVPCGSPHLPHKKQVASSPQRGFLEASTGIVKKEVVGPSKPRLCGEGEILLSCL